MRHSRIAYTLVLSALVSCSSIPNKNVASDSPSSSAYRQLAGMDEVLNDPKLMQKKVEKLMNGIFHGYIIGQVFLKDFDRQLDKNPSKVMRSDAYSSLLAVRTYVDEFEHEINDLYVNLVLASALTRYTPDKKKNAEVALETIGNFMDGVKSDKGQLPENLKPLILSNLREKQTELYEELKALHDDSSFTNNDPEVKKVLHSNMVLLRATRLSYYKELQNYKVDEKVLAATIKTEKKKKSFQDLEREIKALSKEIKSLTNELGRGTSADTIFPTAGPNGNISGKSFPAKTWSLTYDDGPGKTTDQILVNLIERKIPATFFVLAKQVESNPNTAKRIKDAGMDIASHSYTHAQLTKVGPIQLEKEIGTSKKVIEDKMGTSVKLFRLPYGAGVSVSNVRAKIAAHDMIHVFWTVDTLDWQDKNPQSIFARTLKQMNASAKNSGIVLFHDIHSQSVTASTLLMDHFNKQGLIVCTVQGVVNQLNGNLPSCK